MPAADGRNPKRKEAVLRSRRRLGTATLALIVATEELIERPDEVSCLAAERAAEDARRVLWEEGEDR